MNEENKKEEKIPPTVFISYSWTSEEHKQEVIDFSTELMGDGVNVILDIWDAPDGGDLNYFMEENVTSSETDYVLMILDKGYMEKANNREGGVGKETQIISPQVYEQVTETKFLPIVWEKDENNKPYIPIYLSSRKYFDLAGKYFEEYDRLLRKLHNRPEYVKPKVGEIPEEILENKPSYSKLRRYTKRFDNILNQNKDINSVVNDFLNEFWKYLIELKTENIPTNNNLENSTIIYKNIEKYTPLRDYFIIFFENIHKSKYNEDIDVEILIDFFTKLHSLTNFSSDISSNNLDYITFDFILRELFIYLIMIGLKCRNYNVVADLLNSPYYFENYGVDSKKVQKFVDLDNRGHLNTDYYLTYYYHHVKKDNKITGLGDTLIERVHENFEKEELVDADLLCCYVSYLTVVFNDYRHDWFPYTYVYKRSENFMLFRKLSSKRHFDRVKCIFDVDTVDELKEKIVVVDLTFNNHYGFNNVHLNYVEPIHEYIDIEKIGTER